MANTNYDFWVSHALREIKDTYGDVVKIKDKSLLKFGQNNDVDTGSQETVWLRGGNETLPSTNSITHISSSNAGDTQDVKVEGHTISGGELTFVVQTITLQGQTKVALTTPLYRSTRLENDNSTVFAGTIYVYEDDTVVAGVPQTTAKIHLQTDGSNNQSLKAATAFSNLDYGLITHFYADINKQTGSALVDFRLQIQKYGKTFNTKLLRTASSDKGIDLPFKPFLIIPPNSDIRITAETNTNNVSVTAGFNALLAIKT